MFPKLFVLTLFILPSLALAQDKTEADSTVKKIRLSYNVDEQVEPEGGYADMYRKIGANLEYPADARRKGIQGKVVIYVIVDSNGTLVEYGIDTGIGYGCDEAVLKAFKSSNIVWKPAVKDGKKVNAKLKIPVQFKIS